MMIGIYLVLRSNYINTLINLYCGAFFKYSFWFKTLVDLLILINYCFKLSQFNSIFIIYIYKIKNKFSAKTFLKTSRKTITVLVSVFLIMTLQANNFNYYVHEGFRLFLTELYYTCVLYHFGSHSDHYLKDITLV